MKMKASQKLETTALTQSAMKAYYETARNARSRGRKVAWSTVMMPTEILLAADIDVVFPENHSATCGAKGLGAELCELAEDAGLSQETCSYARCDLGVRHGGMSPWGGLPIPDIVFCATSSCTTVMKWFEDIARHYGCELAIVDMPYNFSGEITAHSEQYIVSQLEECIGQIETLTGKTFNYERLIQIMELSHTAHDYWRKCLELGAVKPSPITMTDILVNMGPIVCLRGTQEAVNIYESLHEEIAQRVRIGYVAAGTERFRLVWDGIPFWFALGSVVRRLSELGAVLVGATYFYHWVREVDPADPLRSMGRAYCTAITMNQSVAHKIEKIGMLLKLYQADGLIIHSNRSCKSDSLGALDLHRDVEKQFGVSVLMLDGDHTDSRAVSDAAVQTRMEAFIEGLEQKRFGRLRLVDKLSVQ